MDIWSQYVLPCLCAFAGCIGFTLVFNIHGPGKLIACCGGALGWLVYLLAGKTILAGFFAAMAISLFSEVMARIRRCPVTGYQLVARRRQLLRHGLLSGGRHRAIPQRPAGHSGHGGRPGGWGHPGLLPVPGSVPAPGSRPEAHALRQAKPINDFFSSPAEHAGLLFSALRCRMEEIIMEST